MTSAPAEQFIQLANDFTQQMPFIRFLGINIEDITPETVTLTFPMKHDFVGNTHLTSLHGGVISAVIDTVGAIMSIAAAYASMSSKSESEKAAIFNKSGTLDLRVDYLRPGLGNTFRADATLMRGGKRVSVTRMELHNEEQALIAVGTGTYIIGQA